MDPQEYLSTNALVRLALEAGINFDSLIFRPVLLNALQQARRGKSFGPMSPVRSPFGTPLSPRRMSPAFTPPMMSPPSVPPSMVVESPSFPRKLRFSQEASPLRGTLPSPLRSPRLSPESPYFAVD